MPMASTHFIPTSSMKKLSASIKPISAHWPIVIKGPTLSERTPTFCSRKSEAKLV